MAAHAVDNASRHPDDYFTYHYLHSLFRPLKHAILQLVRASRKQKLQLIPVADAVALTMLASPQAAPITSIYTGAASAGAATADGGARFHDGSNPWERHGAVHNAVRDAIAIAADGAQPRPMVGATGVTAAVLAAVSSSSSSSAPSVALPRITTYGQLYEGLIRGWKLLPLGLYRRLVPGHQPQAPEVTDPIGVYLQSFGGGGSGAGIRGGSGTKVFRNDKSLLSYVLTNPPPDAPLGQHDLVYILRPGSDDDGNDD